MNEVALWTIVQTTSRIFSPHGNYRRGAENSQNQPVIVIETQFFQQHRGRIETYFRLIEQRGDYSYFRERTRGSEDTQ